jgi:hypothetical protein
VNRQGSATGAVVLGLDGFRVLEAGRVDDELELVVETTAARAWCRPGEPVRLQLRPTNMTTCPRWRLGL